jgi:hypothetical protein
MSLTCISVVCPTSQELVSSPTDIGIVYTAAESLDFLRVRITCIRCSDLRLQAMVMDGHVADEGLEICQRILSQT